MLDDAQLTELEQQACDLVRGAGAILLRYFDQPLSIDYKSANNRNPVTDADHAADEYLRGELSRLFPEHAIVTEETESESDDPKEITWVVDPLDGTTNFLHGLPMFACMVCALERGAPVAGAIYIPHIGSTGGRVVHSRRGAGPSRTTSHSRLRRPTRPGGWRQSPVTSCGCSHPAATCAVASATCGTPGARATRWR